MSARARIGRRVAEERTRAGMSRKALAAKLGMDARPLGRLERGERPITSVDLQQLADLLQVPFQALVRDPPAAVPADEIPAGMEEMVAWASDLLEDVEVMMRYVGCTAERQALAFVSSPL